MHSFASIQSIYLSGRAPRRKPANIFNNKSSKLSKEYQFDKMKRSNRSTYQTQNNQKSEKCKQNYHKNHSSKEKNKTIEHQKEFLYRNDSCKYLQKCFIRYHSKKAITQSCQLQNKKLLLSIHSQNHENHSVSHRKYRKTNKKSLTENSATIQKKQQSDKQLKRETKKNKGQKTQNFLFARRNVGAYSHRSLVRQKSRKNSKQRISIQAIETSTPTIKKSKRHHNSSTTLQEYTKKQLASWNQSNRQIDETVILPKRKNELKKCKSKSKRRILTELPQPCNFLYENQQPQNKIMKNQQVQIYLRNATRAKQLNNQCKFQINSKKKQVKMIANKETLSDDSHQKQVQSKDQLCVNSKNLLDVSSILEVNQSSFLSETGKKILFEGEPLHLNIKGDLIKNWPKKDNGIFPSSKKRYFDENLQAIDFKAYRSIPINSIINPSTHSKKNLKTKNAIQKIKKVFPKGFFES